MTTTDKTGTTDTRSGARDTIAIGVRGLHCASCVARLTKVLERQPGVKKADVQLLAGLATVEVTGDQASYETLAQAIEDAGYYASPA